MMETLEAVKWLKEKQLYDISSMVAVSLKKIFTPCLAVKNEKILIVGDFGYENRNVAAVLSGAYYLAAQQLNLDAKLILQNIKSRGDFSDPEVVSGLSELKSGNVIIHISDEKSRKLSVFKGRPKINGKPTVYMCYKKTCSMPITEMEKLKVL